MSALALKYRPTRLEDLVGQRAVKVFLSHMIAKQRVPTALLFEGPFGSGKTSTARILAAALSCEYQSDPPCGSCSSCTAIFQGNSLTVREIDAASHGLVDDVRTLQESLNYVSDGKLHIICIDEAHQLSRAASNALLKTIEEPPEGVLFILLSTDASKILNTITSRCMTFTFSRTSSEDIFQHLVKLTDLESITVENSLLRELAGKAKGSLRNAVVSLDQVLSSGTTTLDEYIQLFGEIDQGARLLEALVSGDHARIFAQADQAVAQSGSIISVSSDVASVLKDLLIIHAGGELPAGVDPAGRREALSHQISAPVAVSAMRILWDLKTKVRVGEETRGHLDLALTLVAETLAGALSPASPLPAPKPRPLSLDEMRKKL